MSLDFGIKLISYLVTAATAVFLSSCGGGSSPVPPTAATSLMRVEIGQTLLQSTEDPNLTIAQQKPFVVRAFFAVPKDSATPTSFFFAISTTQHPAAVSVRLNCPVSFPTDFPLNPSAAQTASATGVCEARASQAEDGSWWSAPGLQITFHALNAEGADVMTPVTKQLANAVVKQNLTIPLCPRIIVDAKGAALNAASVGNTADLNAAVLAYFPFSKVTYCPDAFMPLSVTELSAFGDISISELTQGQMETDSKLMLDTLENYRAARKDGYVGYIHVGLLESSLQYISPPSSDQAYRGTHGVTQHIGGLTLALFVPPSFALGPINYFQYHLIFLHELGHALGLAHAPGCGAGSYDPGYPYINGTLPQDAADPPVTPVGAAMGTKAAVPLRGTLGQINGYQLQTLSNANSVTYPGPAERNIIGTIYVAGNRQVVGSGSNEIPISAFQPGDLGRTQVYDLMNYCSALFYNKWISDYSYRRIVAFSLDRIQPDGSFLDLTGKVTFGNVPAPDNIE